MGLKKLSLGMLAEIDDGRLGVAFDQALQRAEADCRDRPGVETARIITLTTTLVPRASEQGKLDAVTTGFEIKERIPGRKSRDYEMAAAAGGLFYSEHSPEDVDQASLEFTRLRELPGTGTEQNGGKDVATAAS